MDNVKWTDYLNRVSCNCCDRGSSSVNSSAWADNSHKTDLNLSCFEGDAKYPPNLEFLFNCKRVLDIGCGVAHGVKYLRDRGIDAHGITADGDEIKQSKDRLGVDITQGDMHELPFPDGSFDGAYFWDSLEHAVSPVIALWEAWRILVPGGRLIVEMDDENGIMEPSHYYVPNVDQMKELFIHSKFKIDRIRQWGTWGGTYECHKIFSDEQCYMIDSKGRRMLRLELLNRFRTYNRVFVPVHFNAAKPLESVSDNL